MGTGLANLERVSPVIVWLNTVNFLKIFFLNFCGYMVLSYNVMSLQVSLNTRNTMGELSPEGKLLPVGKGSTGIPIGTQSSGPQSSRLGIFIQHLILPLHHRRIQSWCSFIVWPYQIKIISGASYFQVETGGAFISLISTLSTFRRLAIAAITPGLPHN